MDFLNSFYANFFTVGALIPTAFHVFLAYVFLSIKNKSKPTFHLGIAYLFLALFNFGYFISGAFYHPGAAFHRWITVGFILLHETHISMFMLNIHTEVRSRYSRIFLAGMYAISAAVSLFFFVKTLGAPKVFIVSAHHWDFSVDDLSRVIGIIIIAYLAVFIAITAWKVVIVKSRERYFILLMGISYLIASIVPSVANVLSRDGVIDRGTFQVLWDLFSLAGLYILVILYLNHTQDRVPIMAKIVSIILVTVLLTLQGFSYYSFRDNEQSFDTIHQGYTDLAMASGRYHSNISYVTAYSMEDDSQVPLYWNDNTVFSIDFLDFRSEYRNAALFRTIQHLGDERLRDELGEVLEKSHPCFAGYANAIREYTRTLPEDVPLLKKNLLVFLTGIQGKINYHNSKIRAIPNNDFRRSLERYLGNTAESFSPFQNAIEKRLREDRSEGFRLKSSILSMLSPLGAPEHRHYRSHGTDQFISYLHVDLAGSRVYEVGFPYRAYRAYLHPSAMKFIYALFAMLILIIFGFNLFFRGVLITPLQRLVTGLREVGRDNLDVRIPVKLGDETGFLTENFNQMVDTIRAARASLDEYTVNLEQKVLERTRELTHSEERYRTILENIQDGYYEVDLTGKVTFINDALIGIMGYPADEILNNNYSAFTDEKNAKIIYEIFNQVYQTGIPSAAFDYRVIRKDGTTRIIEAVTSLITDHENRKTGFRGILRDITARRCAEEALRESEEKYRSILESIKEGYYEVDLRGIFTFVNVSMGAIFDRPIQDIVGHNFREFMTEETANRVYSAFNRIYRDESFTDKLIYYSITRMDGSQRELEVSMDLLNDNSGEAPGFRGMCRDITERKKAEEALRESEERYRMLIENASDLIYHSDGSGRFTFISPYAYRVTGYAPEDILHKHFTEIIAPDNREEVRDYYVEQFKQNIPETYYEFPMLRKDGEIIWVGQRVKMVIDADNKIEFFCIARDITERKRAEEALVELDRQKSRFFANISHEIRTPLTLMLSPIESVIQGDYGKSLSRDFFRSLHNNGVRLLKLINNLLDFSKIEAGRMTMRVREIDIVRFVRTYIGAVHSAAESKSVSLSFNSETSPMPLFIDPEKMDKVIMNLFSNALKFTSKLGMIDITVEEHDASCSIIFRDTGEGIPSEYVDKIFDRFSRAETGSMRRQEGTGIGLALAKEFVLLHGGTIDVVSKHIEEHPEDHGTVFTVTIPRGREHFENRLDVTVVSEKEGELDESITDRHYFTADITGDSSNSPITSSAETGPDTTSGNPGMPSILVVDDNVEMRDFITMLLKKDFRVRVAENGEEGLKAANRTRPDLIITDVMMPVMDGYEMTRRVKDDPVLHQVPVIMITAKADISNKIEGLEFGADDYLTKPFNSRELLTRIRSLLRAREFEKAIAKRNREIERELEVARHLQERLLPERIPLVSGYSSHAVYIPMDKVGGDFYDYEVRDNFIDLFIADVSGHGIPGAFLAMMTKMTLQWITDRSSQNRTLYLINDVIFRSTVDNNYVTAFLCAIDTHTNRMRYSSAGHCPPLLYRKNGDECIELNAKGKPLGWFNTVTIEEKEFQLLSGDRLILFTDGITECSSPEKEMFGDARFIEFIRENSGLSPEDFSAKLLSRLKKFSRSDKFEDDLTMIVFDVA